MQWNVLNDSEVQAIHQATLRILAEVGIVLGHAGAREVLAGAGARITGARVRLPPDVVEGAVAHCPRRVTIRGRGGQAAVLGDGSLHWHNLGGAREVYDPQTGQRRPATVQDVQDAARLLDALDSVTTVTPFFTPQDVPGAVMSLAMLRHTLSHTVKPLHGPGVQTAAEVHYAARMAAVVGPPAEVLTLGVSPVSPLFFPDDAAESIVEVARLGIPLGPLPCPIAGATAPMTLAGALAQQNAEVLAALVLAQAVRPGLPVVYHGRLAMMDLRTGGTAWGGAEVGLVSAATVQLAHHYGLPVNVYGLSTDVHLPNFQNGYERALNAIVPALAGADELSGIGETGGGALSSYAQIVLDDEVAAAVRRIRRGLAVDESALAVEVIAAVMDGPHNFLSERHTVRALRGGEMLHTRLAERRPWDAWDAAGREGMVERAQAEAARLLAEYVVPPLDEAQERELDDILRAAERELVK
ncbi:MAG: trimethylamine methyltransferase family protein [Anaerolineae bacterium]|nr:trimethylamine methyltransferase family protein [Anaerolineae bacterium]